MKRSDDRWDRWFHVWFAFCGIAGVATIFGIAWLVAYVLPHIVHALDRIP